MASHAAKLFPGLDAHETLHAFDRQVGCVERDEEQAAQCGQDHVGEPSGSTGTVPWTRSRVNVPPIESGSCVPEKLTGLGNASRTSNFLISPGLTPDMLRPM